MILIAQNELNSLRKLAAKIKQAGSQAMRSVGHDQGQRLEDVQVMAAQMETRLEQAGAERPATIAHPFAFSRELLDTPANRRKARALQEAWEAALEVDRERLGNQIGTDGEAQAIELILADVEEELRGSAELLRE